MGRSRATFVVLLVCFAILINGRPTPEWLGKSESKLSNKWAVLVEHNPNEVAESLGLVNEGPIFPNSNSLNNYYLFSHKNVDEVSVKRSANELSIISSTTATISAHPSVQWSEHQTYIWRASRFELPTDPLFVDQWHLENSVNRPQVNVVPVWRELNYFGRDVTIAIVDDGLQYDHPDLSPRYVPDGSWNFVSTPGDKNDSSPYPELDWDSHGTACAGVAAATNDSVCGVGAAYLASLSGIRLLGFEGWTDATEAQAVSYRYNINDIFSNSWGPPDSGRLVEGPKTLTKLAIIDTVTNGRSKLGSVYVWAAGNGLQNEDNCNYDGYANSIYTIAVGAIGSNGKASWYSEPCAAMLVTAPSNGLNDSGSVIGITTTDLLGEYGYSLDDCTDSFGGTSSATPLASGVIALILEANPKLRWQDVQAILAETAVKCDSADSDWVENGAGYHVNHKYGFGLIDAYAAVSLAKNWNSIGRDEAQYNSTHSSGVLDVNAVISNANGSYIEQGYEVNEANWPVSHAIVTLNLNHTDVSDLEVVLESPQGTKSVLAEMRGLRMIPQLRFYGVEDMTEGYLITPLRAAFGKFIDLTVNVTEQLVLADPYDACTALVHNDSVQNYTGRFVLATVGNCTYTQKAYNIQQAGAIGMIAVNNVPGGALTMRGNGTAINIFCVMIGLQEGVVIKEGIVNNTKSPDLGVRVNAYGGTIKDNFGLDYKDWAFTSVRNWGEGAEGTWKVRITDKINNGNSSVVGTWNSWSLELKRGLEVPREEDDDKGINKLYFIIPAIVLGLLLLALAGALLWYFVIRKNIRQGYQVL